MPDFWRKVTPLKLNVFKIKIKPFTLFNGFWWCSHSNGFQKECRFVIYLCRSSSSWFPRLKFSANVWVNKANFNFQRRVPKRRSKKVEVFKPCQLYTGWVVMTRIATTYITVVFGSSDCSLYTCILSVWWLLKSWTRLSETTVKLKRKL